VEVDRYDDAAHRLLIEALARLDDMAGSRRATEVAVEAMSEIGVPFDAGDPLI
jgi:hypothetical protein